MTLVSSSEWLLFMCIVGLIWSFNQYIIIHVIDKIRRNNNNQHQRNHQQTDNNNYNYSNNNDPPTTTTGGTTVLLNQTYDIIYRPVNTTFLESGELRTWLWLILAMLLNIICISIELTLFEELMLSDDD